MPSTLTIYRMAQAKVRKEFAPFTRKFCPTCETPCCVKPCRITPEDVMVAEACGWVPERDLGDPVALVAQANASLLGSGEPEGAGEPCDFLGAHGCTMPDDLRPYGCTTYICPVMLAEMDRMALARLRRAVRELEAARRVFIRYARGRFGDSLDET